MDSTSIDVGIVVGWLAAGAGVLLLIGAACYGVAVYNHLVALQHSVEKAWSDIDVLLLQRHQELPKLVAAAQGYMHHEHDVLVRVTEARRHFDAAYRPDADAAEVARAAGVMGAAIAQLFATAEQYPDLKADSTFAAVSQRITGLESQIADRREYFNHCVNTYNVRIDQFPALLIARPLRFESNELFDVPDPALLEDLEIGFERS